MCVFGTSYVIDALYAQGQLPVNHPVEVTWGSVVHLGRGVALRRGAWALVTFGETEALLHMSLFFSIADVTFVHGQPYSFSSDESFAAWTLANEDIQHPKLEPISIPVLQIAKLTMLHKFSVSDTNTHFAKR